MVYGQPPPTLHCFQDGTAVVQEVEEQLQTRNRMLELLKEHLTAAQQHMKKFVDAHQRDISFTVGN